MTHELKCWPEFFMPVVLGHKTFEIRKDDRSFSVGDLLLLREWDPDTKGYTGSSFTVRVNYITAKFQQEGYVVMSIGPLRRRKS
jgi:hypothetical protein